jgi:hypothetical protein
MHCPATATQPLESAHVVALRQEVGDLLVQSCIDFINEPVNRLILGFAELERLTGLLTRPHPNRPLQLNLFSQAFRALICRGFDLVGNFDSTRHWQLVDAIGFYCDSIPGRWPYTQEPDSVRYLVWSRDYALTLSSSVH